MGSSHLSLVGNPINTPYGLGFSNDFDESCLPPPEKEKENLSLLINGIVT